MKMNKSVIGALVLMVIVAAVYRIIPNRPLGFAPQLALALFGGAVIKDRKIGFALPIVSMLLSDLLYQGLFLAGVSSTKGFYDGQLINYVLLASVTLFGFLIKRPGIFNVLALSLIAPTYFFLVSNFLSWVGVGDMVLYPKTWAGLMASYTAGLPFYTGSVYATVVFSAVLFGSWYVIIRRQPKEVVA